MLGTNAILLAAEIGLFTFEALVVGQLKHRPFLEVVIVLVARVRQAGVLVEAFKLYSLQGFFLYFNFKFVDF